MNQERARVVHVVDDDPALLESTRWLLESVGLRVHGWADGVTFMEALPGLEAGCVLLDVRMPGLGGLALLDALRQQRPGWPVVFVSGHADVPIVLRAFRSGARDFLEKPYNDQMLLDAVQRALAGVPSSAVLSPRPELGPLKERWSRLTPRERDIILPLLQGRTSREVAQALSLSMKTVDLYRGRIMRRMQAPSLPALVGMAIALGQIDALTLRPPEG